jgi:hypothetical protein
MILKVKFIAKKENNNRDDRVGTVGGFVGRRKAGGVAKVIGEKAGGSRKVCKERRFKARRCQRRSCQ